MGNPFASRAGIIVVGVAIGIMATLLQYFGNPPNMGICVACFERDIAGALGLHRAAVVQYIRPEIIGFVIGAFLAALLAKEYRPRGGSAPLVRFFLGVFAMIGALVFLGCPWRAILRLAGGDWNALTGLAGLASGIGVGVLVPEVGLQPRTGTDAEGRRGVSLPGLHGGALPACSPSRSPSPRAAPSSSARRGRARSTRRCLSAWAQDSSSGPSPSAAASAPWGPFGTSSS